MLLYLFVLLVLLIGLFAVDVSLLTGVLIIRTVGNGNELDLIHLLLPYFQPPSYVCFCCVINPPMSMFRSVDIIDVNIKAARRMSVNNL
jgi:hypothetical protein